MYKNPKSCSNNDNTENGIPIPSKTYLNRLTEAKLSDKVVNTQFNQEPK